MKTSVFIFLITAFTILGCKQTDSDTNITDRETFTKILTDIHLTDGIIETTKLQSKKSKYDLYKYVYEKHNVTKEQFIATVEYYTAHSDEYKAVYDDIESELKARISRQEGTNPNLKKVSKNLWNQNDYWKIPNPEKNDKIYYSYISNKQGTYTLEADYLIFDDDDTVNPFLMFKANYSDTTEQFFNVYLKKTGEFEHVKSILKTNKKYDFKSISGFLYTQTGTYTNKHAVIKNISLRYSPSK